MLRSALCVATCAAQLALEPASEEQLAAAVAALRAAELQVQEAAVREAQQMATIQAMTAETLEARRLVAQLAEARDALKRAGADVEFKATHLEAETTEALAKVAELEKTLQGVDSEARWEFQRAEVAEHQLTALGKELGKCASEKDRLNELMMDMKRAWEADLHRGQSSCNDELDKARKDCDLREERQMMFAKAMEQRAEQAEQRLHQLSGESRCADIEARSKIRAKELAACELSRANLSASCEDLLERVGQANSSCHDSRDALRLSCSKLEPVIAALKHDLLTTSQKLEASEVSRIAAQRQLAKARRVEVDNSETIPEYQDSQPSEGRDVQCESPASCANDETRDMVWHIQEMRRLCGSNSQSSLHGVVCPMLAHVRLDDFVESPVYPQHAPAASHVNKLLDRVRATVEGIPAAIVTFGRGISRA